MDFRAHRIVIVIGVAVVIVFCGFVWPTMYRYEHIRAAQFDGLARINRLTGDTWTLYQEGPWHHVGTETPWQPPEVSKR